MQSIDTTYAYFVSQALPMALNNPYEKYKLVDNGGRRTGGDRRSYSYSVYLPERRSGKDRRSGIDRRRFPRYKVV